VLRRFQDCQFQTQLPVYLLEPQFFFLQLTQVITDLGPLKVGPYKTDAAPHKDEQHENDQKNLFSGYIKPVPLDASILDPNP
jgi:hypothetical protein